MKTTKRIEITRSEMVELLRNVNTPRFVSFWSRTSEKMNKYLDYWVINDEGKKKKNPNPTENPFFEKGIVKISKKYQIITGFEYEDNVNKQREREGKVSDFVSKENWFNVLSKGLVTDKSTESKFYLRYRYLPESTLVTKSFHGKSSIEKQMYEQFLTDRSDYENQDLDNPIRFQVCDLRNIHTLSIDGERYKLVD